MRKELKFRTSVVLPGIEHIFNLIKSSILVDQDEEWLEAKEWGRGATSLENEPSLGDKEATLATFKKRQMSLSVAKRL